MAKNKGKSRHIQPPSKKKQSSQSKPQTSRRVSGVKGWMLIAIVVIMALGGGGLLLSQSIKPSPTPTLVPTETPIHSSTPIRTFSRHTDRVYSVAFSPDGSKI